MVKQPRTTHQQSKVNKGNGGLDMTVESQEGIAKSNKESLASKGASDKEDAKVTGKDQEEFIVEKRTLLVPISIF
eukprot:7642715-Ditylum_brightwellii.AAC.1